MSLTLLSVVAQHPYDEYQEWWPIGNRFLSMMSEAILAKWTSLVGSAMGVDAVQEIVEEYVSVVYKREARSGLARAFAVKGELGPLQSGEFDALSYGFYRSAYDLLASKFSGSSLGTERRKFAVGVGAHFFSSLVKHLELDLPRALNSEADFRCLRSTLDGIGEFLLDQGYLRSHFAFRFDVKMNYDGNQIDQEEEDFLRLLGRGGAAYGLYEMGHPVILPSAVYLYHTVGEAQHHSSRTIEELFARTGCDAWETDDFDPSGYPSELVVELWQIRLRGGQNG